LKQRVKGAIRPIYRLVTYPARVAVRRLRAALQVSVDLGPLQHAVQGYLEESERATAALVKGLHQSAAANQRDWWAVPLGSGRVLGPHPALPFMYLHAEDVELTPRLLLGQWGGALQALWPRIVRPGWAVIEARANQGFHTLTLAQLVGPAGRVVAFEPDPLYGPVLSQNLRAHRLDDRVTAHARPFDLTAALAASGRRPDLVCLDALDLGTIRILLRQDEPPWLVLGAGRGDTGWPAAALRQIEQAGLRLWEVGPEGSLRPLGTRGLPETSPPGDVLAARSLD
jgi:hypothetical protein